MLQILLGPDDFSKKEYIEKLAKEKKAEIVSLSEGDELPSFGSFLAADLFSGAKVFALRNVLAKYDLPVFEKQAAESKNVIVFMEEKLDKRLSATKAITGSKYIETKEFNLPHGRELDLWVEKRIKALGGSISPLAVSALAAAMGRDAGSEVKFGGRVVEVKEAFTLWQVDSEVRKLLSFSSGMEITPEDVKNLSGSVETFDVLKIVNAIGEGRKTEGLKLVEGFLSGGSGEDQKGLVIQLNALLSEQFRNIFVLQGLLSRRMPDEDILQKTGWKSGRLFVLKKLAGKLKPVSVKECLNRLEHLDEELKTSSTPPRVLLDLILSQVA